jgi:hypothetical protein
VQKHLGAILSLGLIAVAFGCGSADPEPAQQQEEARSRAEQRAELERIMKEERQKRAQQAPVKPKPEIPTEEIDWIVSGAGQTGLWQWAEARVTEAAAQDRPSLVFLTGPWVRGDAQLSRTVWNQPQIDALAERFAMVKVRLLDHTQAEQLEQMAKMWNIPPRLPAIVFFNANGERVEDAALSGDIAGAQILETMQKLAPPVAKADQPAEESTEKNDTASEQEPAPEAATPAEDTDAEQRDVEEPLPQ